MLKPTKILVPTDFSEYSNIALKQAFDIALEYKAELFVVHVVEERVHYAMYDVYHDNLLTETMQKIEGNFVKTAHDKLAKQLGKIPWEGELSVTADVLVGATHAEIIRYQKEKGIDLIVISSLGRTGLARFFIGSVARTVLKEASCPVLLTKGDPSDQRTVP